MEARADQSESIKWHPVRPALGVHKVARTCDNGAGEDAEWVENGGGQTNPPRSSDHLLALYASRVGVIALRHQRRPPSR